MHEFLTADTSKLEKAELTADSIEQADSLRAMLMADNEFFSWVLSYTAGKRLSDLSSQFESVVLAYERYQKAQGLFQRDSLISPLGLENLEDYERSLQLISIAILIGRLDLFERLVNIIDPSYRSEDALYEEIVGKIQPGRANLEEWYHDQPYRTLLDAIDAEDKQSAANLLSQYCKIWYPAFKSCPWHNSHLSITSTEGAYFGYWAFEAGAVAYLYGIDDSQINHMVYPKDLVAYARNKKEQDGSQLKVYAGEPCPRSGYWFCSAKQNSLQYFKQGVIMPTFPESKWGATIWYWSRDS